MARIRKQLNYFRIERISDKNMSPAELDAAIWLFRIAYNNIHPEFINEDGGIQSFLESGGDNLFWSDRSINFIKTKIGGAEDVANNSMETVYGESELSINNESIVIDNETFIELVKQHRPFILSLLKDSLDQLESLKSRDADPVRENVKHLQKLLDLDVTESEILLFAGRMGQSVEAINVFKNIQVNGLERSAQILATILSLKPTDVLKAIKKGSRLHEYKLIEINTSCDLERLVQTSELLLECIYESHETLDGLICHFIRPAVKTNLTVQNFQYLKEDYSALYDFIKGVNAAAISGVNILLYGKPGTGKTEFVKMFSQEASLNLFEVACTDSDGDPLRHSARLASLVIAQRFLESKPNSLIIFDEIEDIFPSNNGHTHRDSYRPSSQTISKAWINRCLETNKTPVIWISNAIDQIDPAYLRRFSYHLEFRNPPLEARSIIAEGLFSEIHINPDFIKQVAEDPSLTPAQIEKAAQFVTVSGVTNKIAAEALANRVIMMSKRAMGNGHAPIVRKSSTQYDLKFLNIESRYPVENIVGSLNTAESSSLCFYGPPGTGKTALARHIAELSSKPLLTKRASDVLSKWLGEAEKNIAEMFQEAESEGAILFLDEADSLLRDRNLSKNSWEVTQVNEMLQQMECFRGVFICATNLFGSLDQAALRRFSFKLKFNPMNLEQRLRMFSHEALASSVHSLDAHLHSRLALLTQLTPGDFAIVNRQKRIMNEVLSPSEFMEILEVEHALKPDQQSKRIGFFV